jgi:transcriptional regulator with XRE-family HTH domain
VVVNLKQDALREHIARRNISQNSFALKAGISSAYIAQLLGGKRRASGFVRKKLLDASGLQFDDLFEVKLSDAPA